MQLSVLHNGVWLVALFILAACGGGGGDAAPAPASVPSYTVGGMVTGLSGTLVLRNNNSEALTLSGDGAFTFTNAVANGSIYEVTVATQPTGQYCTVIPSGSATMAGANVANIVIDCTNVAPPPPPPPIPFTIGGSVSGLSGTVTLRNNLTDNLTLTSDGGFTFATALADLAGYEVSVASQPVNQTCTVTSGGRGTIAGADVTNVAVMCTSSQPIILNTISVSPTTANIPVGATFAYAATGHYSDGSSHELTSSVMWTSSSTSVASIDNFGMATGVGGGATTIAATLNGISGSASMTVTTKTLTSISLTPATVSVQIGDSLLFTVNMRFSDGSSTPITSAQLASSSPSVASVSGLSVTGIAPGTSLITAKFLTFSDSAALTVLESRFFAANDGITGSELWKTDGTTDGTVLVKDINPNGDSKPGGFAPFKGAVFFAADDGVNGSELWKTDGSTAGTVLVKNINNTLVRASSYPGNFIIFNDELYFSADGGINGRELWKSDGTANGTIRVKDINIGSGDSNPENFIVSNGALYFTADDGVSGTELWKTNGSASGTLRVKDVNPGGGSSYPRYFTIFNGELYFVADDGVSGRELWKTNGTAGGTVQVMDINIGANGSSPSNFAMLNSAIYFNADDGVNGSELWTTDGSTTGTYMVKDINTGSGEGSGLARFVVYKNEIYFGANDGIFGFELWKTDGTTLGTVKVKSINIQIGSTGSYPGQFFVFNGELYFTADDGIHAYELWKTDGTASGTVLVKDIDPLHGHGSDPRNFFLLNRGLFFIAGDSGTGAEYWTTDGTVAGTLILKDICPGSCYAF